MAAAAAVDLSQHGDKVARAYFYAARVLPQVTTSGDQSSLSCSATTPPGAGWALEPVPLIIELVQRAAPFASLNTK